MSGRGPAKQQERLAMVLKKHARGFLLAYPAAGRMVQRLRRPRRRGAADPYWFLRHLRSPANTVIVDAGANVGQSVTAMRRARPDIPIHAFEPAAATFAQLRRRTEDLEAVTLHQAALCDAPGEMTFYTPAYDGQLLGALASLDHDSAAHWLTQHGGVFIDRRKITVQEETVQVTRLDDCALAPCFIKIDVQGVAPGLLRGAEATLAAHKPVLFVERERDDGLAEQLSRLSYRDYVLRNGRLVPYGGEKDSIMLASDSAVQLDLPRS